jgi:hypothetical protein
MQISGCLKMSVGDNPPVIYSFTNYDFQPFIDTNPSFTVDGLASYFLLRQAFFNIDILNGIFFSELNVSPFSSMYAGMSYNRFTLEGMEDRTTFAGFDESKIKTFLIDLFSGRDAEGNLILPSGISVDSSIASFNQYLAENSLAPLEVSEGNSNVRIYEMSLPETNSLQNVTGAEYKDYFQYLKNSIGYTTDKLEQEGYEKSMYYSSGEYIEIKSGYSLVPRVISCTPTEVRFTPSVTLPSNRNKVYLRFRVEDSNGNSLINYNGENEFVENIF